MQNSLTARLVLTKAASFDTVIPLKTNSMTSKYIIAKRGSLDSSMNLNPLSKNIR